MRTGGLAKSRVISLKDKLKELKIYSLSRTCNFCKRKVKKISAVDLILSFYNCSVDGSFSLSGWASQLSLLINEPVSKQAIFERVNTQFIDLVRQLLDRSLSSKLKSEVLIARFKNIYLQDSTNGLLPRALRPFYQGNGSLTGSHSIIKIQVIFNLVKNAFVDLTISSFTRNDQTASCDILKLLRPGDLVIRDLGYFVMDSLKSIMDLKAHFICPLKKSVSLFSAKNGEPIRLKKILHGKAFLKQKVLIGAKQKLEVTLVAVKLDKKTARYRVNSAINDRDRRHKCSAEKLHLLEWDIFISSSADLTPQEIQAIYKIRWQIEIIFKSWKSNLKIEKNIPARLSRPFIPEAIIYLTLLLAAVFIMPAYHWAQKNIKNVSLLKLTQFIASTMPFQSWIISFDQLQHFKNLILYETRNRANFYMKTRTLT